MNTESELVNNYGIPPITAKQMIDQYTATIGKTYGVNIITDITYTGDRHRDITLECSKCHRVTHMDFLAGRNKLKEISKTRKCQKIPKIKKESDYVGITDPSWLGKHLSGFVVIGFRYKPHKNKSGGSNLWIVECESCKRQYVVSPSKIKNGEKVCACRKEPSESKSKYIGKTINRLKIEDVFYENGKAYAKCECVCGGRTVQQLTNVVMGKVKSCGCLRDELSENAVYKSPLYATWANMRDRCLNEKNRQFNDYGGRGISICDEWRNDFRAFETWGFDNGYRPGHGLSLDRIDVNGNYEPANCRWANIYVQNANQRPRKKKLYTINGVSKSLKEWCAEYGVYQETVRYRMNHMGLSFEDALKRESDGRGNHFAGLNAKKREELSDTIKLDQTKSYIEANLMLAFIRANFSQSVIPQKRIGRYSVDFWIDGTDMVIECDGKDAHSSIEQKNHDYERERYLIASGYKVIRYTGSEINKDPDKCVREIISLVGDLR